MAQPPRANELFGSSNSRLAKGGKKALRSVYASNCETDISVCTWGIVAMSVRLLAVGSRQRTTCNLRCGDNWHNDGGNDPAYKLAPPHSTLSFTMTLEQNPQSDIAPLDDSLQDMFTDYSGNLFRMSSHHEMTCSRDRSQRRVRQCTTQELGTSC